jgi:hypothetical protein
MKSSRASREVSYLVTALANAAATATSAGLAARYGGRGSSEGVAADAESLDAGVDRESMVSGSAGWTHEAVTRTASETIVTRMRWPIEVHPRRRIGVRQCLSTIPLAKPPM